MMFTYKYPRPAVTADSVVICSREGILFILLVRRSNETFKGYWALPGGFMDMDEQLEETARRELQEETGIKPGRMTFAGIFDKPDRDPRGRTVTAVYLMRLSSCDQNIRAGSDAGKVQWFPLDSLPELAFDHRKILTTVLGGKGMRQ